MIQPQLKDDSTSLFDDFDTPLTNTSPSFFPSLFYWLFFPLKFNSLTHLIDGWHHSRTHTHNGWLWMFPWGILLWGIWNGPFLFWGVCVLFVWVYVNESVYGVDVVWGVVVGIIKFCVFSTFGERWCWLWNGLLERDVLTQPWHMGNTYRQPLKGVEHTVFLLPHYLCVTLTSILSVVSEWLKGVTLL